MQNGGKPARGRVILAATAKGGAGKSTTIACLACWWQAAGRSIALVDADPNRTLTRWHAKGAALGAVPLVSEAHEERIVDAIDGLTAAHELVLVDCPGFNGQVTLFAVGTADCVLIPCMTDEANVFEALRMGKLVDNVAKLANRPIPSYALLTRVKRASVAAHSRAQLETLQARPLTSFLSDRAVFQESSFHGSSPVALEPRGQATREIKALAAEVWAIIAPKGG